MSFDLTNPIFQNADKARAYLESVRWADGANCPHCGSVSVRKMTGKAHRKGAYQCNDCRKQFSVTVGTIFERSKVPLHKWLAAFYLLSSSKKGMPSHQIHRMLGITYKTAWFMTHRIREAMKDDNPGPLGGSGKAIEADETFIGHNPDKYEFHQGRWKPTGGISAKYKVVTLVERGGKARSVHVDRLTSRNIRDILVRNADRQSDLMTDEAAYYYVAGMEFASHQRVNHGEREYVRGEAGTNTVEGYFSIFKRGMRGVYQHCGEKHLQRYLHEFDFRYSHRDVTDDQRTVKALRGAEGKRLTYRRTGVGTNV